MKTLKMTILALAFFPFVAMAQSVDNSTLQQATISLSELSSLTDLTDEEKEYYENFLQDLQNTGEKINENSDVWAQETAKRGYPKKKTVREKASLVDHTFSC